jgi:hypothetical protein
MSSEHLMGAGWYIVHTVHFCRVVSWLSRRLLIIILCNGSEKKDPVYIRRKAETRQSRAKPV